MRTLFITITLLIFVNIFNGQNVKDFFVLDSKYTKAIYKTSDNIVIEKDYMLEGNLVVIKTTAIKTEMPYSVSEEQYEVKSDKILKIRDRFETFGVTRSDTVYKENNIVFQLPEKNKKSEWSFTDEDSYNCKAEFTKVKYNNIMYDAVLVKRTDKETKDVDILYYLKGIGLFKTDFVDDNGKNHSFLFLTKLVE